MKQGIKFGSVCSGIEAASVAWEPLGWSADWFAEIEKFPAAVLAHHWPETPNLGDMTTIAADVLRDKVSAPEVLVGGTPCQAFSVAGMRKGLDDERGQLTIKYVELLNAIDHVRTGRGDEPAVCVWENVPGVLSDRGNAFGCFLGALAGEDCELQPAGKKWANAGCVYGPQRAVAWRVLDAQYFGVAQRRRRVFVVASARNGFDPAAVLFEREGLRRDIAPSREAETAVAALAASGVGTCGADDNQAQSGHLQPVEGWPADAACTLNAAFGEKQGLEDQHINGGASLFVPTSIHGTQDPIVSSDYAHTLGRNNGQENALFTQLDQDVVGTLTAGFGKLGAPEVDAYTAIPHGFMVRRLTPTECERLQGFPDSHTQIPWRNKTTSDCPDGPRYKALGNSKAVPVVNWLGRRLQQALEVVA